MLTLALLTFSLAQLPDIPAPLGHVGNVVLTDSGGGVSSYDIPVRLKFPNCEATQIISVANLVGGAKDALATLKVWFQGQPDLEKKLLGAAGAFGRVMAMARKGSVSPLVPCKSPPPIDAFRFAVRKAPTQDWCKVSLSDTANAEHWFKNAEGKWAFATRVAPPQHSQKPCFPAASVIFFDAKGVVRARYDADFGGEVSARVFGDKDQCLDFTFDQAAQVFHPTLGACKAP